MSQSGVSRWMLTTGGPTLGCINREHAPERHYHVVKIEPQLEEDDQIEVVPLYPLLSAFDSAYHPQMHYEGHPVDFLMERLGLTEEDYKAWREWEANR